MFRVTLETWKPLLAAFKFDGDDVNITIVVRASRLSINVCTIYLHVMNHHRLTEIRSGLCSFKSHNGGLTWAKTGSTQAKGSEESF